MKKKTSGERVDGCIQTAHCYSRWCALTQTEMGAGREGAIKPSSQQGRRGRSRPGIASKCGIGFDSRWQPSQRMHFDSNLGENCCRTVPENNNKTTNKQGRGCREARTSATTENSLPREKAPRKLSTIGTCTCPVHRRSVVVSQLGISLIACQYELINQQSCGVYVCVCALYTALPSSAFSGQVR